MTAAADIVKRESEYKQFFEEESAKQLKSATERLKKDEKLMGTVQGFSDKSGTSDKKHALALGKVVATWLEAITEDGFRKTVVPELWSLQALQALVKTKNAFCLLMANSTVTETVQAHLSNFEDHSQYFASKELCANILQCKIVFHKLTAPSNYFCKSFFKTQYFAQIAGELLADQFSPEYTRQFGRDLGNPHLRMVRENIGILYNCVRRDLSPKKRLRKLCGVAMLVKQMESDVSQLRIWSLMTLALTADLEQSSSALHATNDNLKILVGNILRTCKYEGINFSRGDVLQVISALSKNEENAVTMLDLGILEILEKEIGKVTTEAAQVHVLTFIWNLTFHDKCRETLNEEKELILGMVHRFKDTQNKEMKDAYSGILVQLNQVQLPAKENPATEEGAAAASGGQVMISYNWEQQWIAKMLAENLKRNAGIKVWIDVEQMEGDMLQKMAEAVEGSDLIVACVSESYRDSNNCRLEVTYAFRKEKPIVFVMVEEGFKASGWLGALMRADLYYSLYQEDLFHTEYPKLSEYIQKTLGISSVRVDASLTSLPAADSPAPAQGLNKSASWTRDEVEQWTRECELDVAPLDLDGGALYELRVLLHQDPAGLHHVLKELGLNHVRQRLDFAAALRKLGTPRK